MFAYEQLVCGFLSSIFQEDGESLDAVLDQLRSSIGAGPELWVLKASESNKGQARKKNILDPGFSLRNQLVPGLAGRPPLRGGRDRRTSHAERAAPQPTPGG